MFQFPRFAECRGEGNLTPETGYTAVVKPTGPLPWPAPGCDAKAHPETSVTSTDRRDGLAPALISCGSEAHDHHDGRITVTTQSVVLDVFAKTVSTERVKSDA